MIQEKIIDQTLVVTETVTETVVERVILSDATTLEDGTSWDSIRAEAMQPDFKTSSTFLDLSATDQELVCALIEFEEAKEVVVVVF